MADRFWVGGTGTWNTTNTANWSTTDGGAGGASVPTSTDDVYFSGSSGTGIVTISGTVVCQGFITFYPTNSSVTFSASGATIQVYTIFDLSGVAGTFSGTPAIQFLGSFYGNLAPNGKTLGAVTVNMPGGGVSLGGALTLTTSASLTITAGEFTTNGYAVTTRNFTSTGTAARTINLANSTITLGLTSSVFNADATNQVFNAGTSLIQLRAPNPTLSTGTGLSFYNVTFTSTALAQCTIGGANTFNNLTFSTINSVGVSDISIGADQTINGTLTLPAGTNATMRTLVRSNILGTPRTLTCAAGAWSGAERATDFRDIVIAGAAAPLSGVRLGDCGGNSGITFPAAKTVYWRATGSANWGATTSSWSLTSGGAADHTAFPLAQDTAVFPAATYPASGSTATINAAYTIGTIDMSARTSNTMMLATTASLTVCGNWINGTGVTLSGTNVLTFAGRGSQTITSAGRAFTQGFTINTSGGSVTLQDAFSNSGTSTTFSVHGGTFSANGYSFTLSGASSSLNANNTNARTVAVGSGTWTIAGSAWNAGTSTNLTVTGTGTISLTSASAKTFAGGGIQTYPTINQGGTGTLTITGSNKFANITNTAIGRVQFQGGTTNEFSAFDLNGTAGNLLQLGSTTTIQAILKKPGAWNVGANSTDAGFNTGLTFA